MWCVVRGMRAGVGVGVESGCFRGPAVRQRHMKRFKLTLLGRVVQRARGKLAVPEAGVD